MQDDGIKCMPIGRVKRSRKNRWRECMDLLTGMAAIVLVGVLAGAGFGWGLALISVWL